MFSNKICNRLGGFSGGRAAGCGPWFLCLISAGSAMEIFVFGVSVVGAAGSGMGTGAALDAGSSEKSLSLLVLCTFLLILIIRLYGLVVYIYCK